MSVLSERPTIPLDTSQATLASAPDSPIAVPDVVVNGKRPITSAMLFQRRPKSSASNYSASATDEWGSHFWVTLVDPQTQTQFYACPATGQVSWDPPIGSFLLPPSDDGEWWELTDDSRGGIPYYYHTKTGETVWERPGPDAFVIPLGILQNTSLARRLSARFSTSAQNDGSLPPLKVREDRKPNRPSISSERPPNRKTRSPHLPAGDGSPEPRDPKRRSQSSTQSSGGRLTPSSGSPVPKKTRHVVRRSFSSDQYGGFSQHVNHLPTIPASDASSVLSAPASARRKSTSTLRSVSYEKDSPPKNGSGSTRSKHKAYSTHRPPQPQSLNAAVELLSSPPKLQTSRLIQEATAGKKLSPTHLTIPPKPAHLRPSQSVPTTPTQQVRNPSSPVIIHGKEISAPVLNQDAAMSMGPAKERANAHPILIEREVKPKIPTERTNGTAMPILPQDLQSDIQQFVQSDFAKRYFSTHRTGFIFRRTVPVTEMMSWQKTPLSAPLLSLTKDLHKNAVRAFKVIQRIMGDRERERAATRADRADSLGGPGNASLNGSTSSLVGSLGVLEEERWLLSEALTHGELRDEVYCQIVKQLIGNPSTEGVFKGWQLLCVFLVTFPPSKNFETYLQSFITQRTTHSEGRVDVMAKYCLRRLAFISKKGPRGKAPTAAEIETASDAAFNPSVFGETLDIIYRLQQRTYPLKVPIILPFLADGILALGGTRCEGIFRVPGDGDGVSELKLQIDKGHYTLEGVDDPNILASLMKLWLRELCDPLVPEEMYNVCVSSSRLPEACVELVKRLPTINRRVVLFVISFLQLFLEDKIQATTKMTPANLALVMAPNILRCNSDSMAVVFNNAQYEQEFVYHLLLHLKCNEIDPDYVPVHGQGVSRIKRNPGPRNHATAING